MTLIEIDQQMGNIAAMLFSGTSENAVEGAQASKTA
jgi:hypothetical protein